LGVALLLVPLVLLGKELSVWGSLDHGRREENGLVLTMGFVIRKEEIRASRTDHCEKYAEGFAFVLRLSCGPGRAGYGASPSILHASLSRDLEKEDDWMAGNAARHVHKYMRINMASDMEGSETYEYHKQAFSHQNRIARQWFMMSFDQSWVSSSLTLSTSSAATSKV
jgi:hypothetical protein